MSLTTRAVPHTEKDARDELASRVIPQMVLSIANSPLTRPLPPPATTIPTERALARFGVEGNAVVTGGAGNLALQSSRALLEHGLSALCIMDLATTLKSSAASIKQLQSDFPDRPIIPLPVDVTSSTAVTEAFADAASQLPGNTVDVLCCFAGIVGCDHSISAPLNNFQKILEVNLTGSFLCAQAASAYMIKSKKGGSIVFTASISGHRVNFPQPQVAYNASKAAVVNMTRSLAAEWAVHGIRVNSISPGYMDTVLNEGDGLKDMRAIWASRCPMGRMGVPEEITGPVVLLCSRTAGRYMTGSDLIVDGGATCF